MREGCKRCIVPVRYAIQRQTDVQFIKDKDVICGGDVIGSVNLIM